MSGKKYYVLLDDSLRHTFAADDDMQALVTAFITGYEGTEVYRDDRRVGITPRSVWEDEYLDKWISKPWKERESGDWMLWFIK